MRSRSNDARADAQAHLRGSVPSSMPRHWRRHPAGAAVAAGPVPARWSARRVLHAVHVGLRGCGARAGRIDGDAVRGQLPQREQCQAMRAKGIAGGAQQLGQGAGVRFLMRAVAGLASRWLRRDRRAGDGQGRCGRCRAPLHRRQCDRGDAHAAAASHQRRGGGAARLHRPPASTSLCRSRRHRAHRPASRARSAITLSRRGTPPERWCMRFRPRTGTSVRRPRASGGAGIRRFPWRRAGSGGSSVMRWASWRNSTAGHHLAQFRLAEQQDLQQFLGVGFQVGEQAHLFPARRPAGSAPRRSSRTTRNPFA